MSFSIYDLDEDIRKLLSLDNFLGGLSVNEFIEELSKDHFNKGAEVNKLEYLDPKPYIRTFESTVRELKRLHDDSDLYMKKVDKEVERYELTHSENVLALSLQVEAITENFNSLDKKISLVSGKIDPLGRSLNKITNSRDRSQETIFLIRAYHGFFTKETYEPLVKLKASPKFEDKIQCAKAINNLLTLSKKIASPELTKAKNCVLAIEKFSETFEKELLIKFDVYFEDDEYERMKEVASILHEFNGGATVVQVFVNKHDFMLEETPEDVPSLLDDEGIWAKLSDPNYSQQIKDPLTEYLLDGLRMTIKAEARIMQQVFGDPTPVLRIFIERIYAQVIQNKTTSLLLHSLSVGSLAHVRVLHALYVLLGDFSRDIKEFLTTNDLNSDDELGAVLDQCFYDLFIEYTTELTYFAREKKNLQDTVYEIAQKYNSYHENELNAKGLEVKIESMNSNEYNNDKSKIMSFGNSSFALNIFQDRFGFHFSEKKRISQFKDFMKTKLGDSKPQGIEEDPSLDPEYPLYRSFNIGFVETVVKSSVESVARVIELAHNKTPEFSLEILEIVLFDFGKLYITACLEVAYEEARKEASFTRSGGTSPHNFNFQYLEIFNSITEGLNVISQCIKKVFLPCAVNNPNIRSRMCNLTNNCLQSCEVSINVILEETLELVNSRTAFLLTKQKKKDFVVDNIDEEDTEACEEVTDFLNDTYVQVIRHLNGVNLKNFFIKEGMNLLNQLLEHYKRFPVNSTGGIILTKDVIQFQSTVDSWKIPEISEQFQILKEIANLFTVHPDLINSLVSEGQLANVKPYTIRQYVMKRTDFNPSYIERFFK